MNKKQLLDKLDRIKEDLNDLQRSTLVNSNIVNSNKVDKIRELTIKFEEIHNAIVLGPPGEKCSCCDGTGRK